MYKNSYKTTQKFYAVRFDSNGFIMGIRAINFWYHWRFTFLATRERLLADSLHALEL